MNRFGFALVTLVACSDSTTTAPTQLNLDRPVDIAFACFGDLRLTDGGPGDVTQPIITTAQPVQSCEIRSGPQMAGDKEPPPPAGQEMLDTRKLRQNWYGFILQSGPGTVAISRWDTKPSSSFAGGDVVMLDADPLTPGKNSISVGEDPIAIETDTTGCFEVIANQGSCDLSVLDVNSVFSAKPIVSRRDIKNGAGQVIHARPAAMAFQPASSTIGVSCPATSHGLAYIAYPGCHLVAGVDVETGTIVTGIQFAADGTPSIITDPSTVTCPAECDGMAPLPGVRPVAVDVELDSRMGRVVLAIGADNSNVLTVYDLDPLLYRPLSLTSIPFENTNGRLGITALAVTPLIGMGGANPTTTTVIDEDAPGGDHQFVYAVANDATVHVAEITGAPKECDTQVDPRYLQTATTQDVSLFACFPVGDPRTPPRRTGARGPGIELIGDGVPTSVEVFKVDPIPADSRGIDPQRMIGYFGVITATNGQSFVFNVDDDIFADTLDVSDRVGTPIPLVIAHQLRDAVKNRGLRSESGSPVQHVCDDPGPDPDSQAGNQGGPRSVAAPSHIAPASVIALEKTGGLPSIQQVLCTGSDGTKPVSELFFGAPDDVRSSVFPDLRGLRIDEVWTLTWEGPLSADKVDQAVDGPAVRTGQIASDGSGIHLIDDTHAFCDAGVQPFDIVQLRGCDPSIGDAGCPIGYTCYVHPASQIPGLGQCMRADEAERLATACKDFLTSQRRYTVGRTTSGELQLLPRKVVLRTTPLDGCTDDDECRLLADYALSNATSTQPFENATSPDPHTWSCMTDVDRAPLAGTGKRCVLTCTDTKNCTTGSICEDGICMEGVVPPQSCINAPERYELRASEAFTVIGSRQGYMHPIVADTLGNCVKGTTSPYLAGRIPLTAPACDPTADPFTGKLPAGGFEPNPCALTVPETEYNLNYLPGTCTLGSPDETLVTRDAKAIRLRNRGMTLTLVDPTYQGDARCNGDRAGTLQNVPLVMPGYQIAFRQTAGFAPLTLSVIAPSFPVKVVRGPTQSIWVVDNGDFLSTSITQASTRGKVYRVESRALNIFNVLQ